MPGLKSILNPEHSVAIGVGIGAVDLFIFEKHLPPIADIRTANQGNTDIETARKQATWLCIGVNGLVSVMTRDWNVFLIGGLVTASMSWLYAHANAVNPETGKMSAPGNVTSLAPDMAAQYPMADYGYGSEAAS